MKSITNVINFIGSYLLCHAPGSIGRRLRYLYYRGKFKSCGYSVTIDTGVVLIGLENISLGNNVWLDTGCILIAGKANFDGRIVKRKPASKCIAEGELFIGSDVHLAPFCIVQAHGGVCIGDNCGLSSGVKVYSLSNLPYNPFDRSDVINFSPFGRSAYLLGSIVLNSNTGVALNSILLPGVEIGCNSFVAINSVVKTTFQPNSLIEGNPAKLKGPRFIEKNFCEQKEGL